MAVDREFPDVRRRLRWLEDEVASIERTLEMSGGPDSANQVTIYILGQHTREFEQIEYLLRYYTRQNNGYHLNRAQWGVFVFSLATAVALLLVYLLQVVMP